MNLYSTETLCKLWFLQSLTCLSLSVWSCSVFMWWSSVLKFAQTLRLPLCSRGSLDGTFPKGPGMCWPGAVTIRMELFGCCKAQHHCKHKGWEQPVSPAFLSLLLLLIHRQYGEGEITIIWIQMGGEREKIKKEELKREDLWKQNIILQFKLICGPAWFRSVSFAMLGFASLPRPTRTNKLGPRRVVLFSLNTKQRYVKWISVHLILAKWGCQMFVPPTCLSILYQEENVPRV